LGEIVNLEILNWHQLVVLKWDKQLGRGLGKPIPDSANPSSVYDGATLIRVLGTETHTNKGQPLDLSVIALGTGDTPPVLKVRPWPQCVAGSSRGPQGAPRLLGGDLAAGRRL
jgi:hypothetical protein